MRFGGFWGCVAGRRALGLVVAVLLVGSGAGLLLSSASAAASQHGRAAVSGGRHVIRGGPGNNVLRGSRGNDVIYGGRGRDQIYGGRGRDRIYGGPGADVIDGGLGSDRIYGGPGNDVIHGGRGNDRIYGGLGNDVIYGGPGREVIYGGRGDDRIFARKRRARRCCPGLEQQGRCRRWPAQRSRGVRGRLDQPHQRRGHQVAHSCSGRESTVSYGGSTGVSDATWMHDLGSQLWSRKLSDVIIPGSHDTATYGLPNDPISLIGKAQTEDITSQLNDGIRDFDIRVKFNNGENCPGADGCCGAPGTGELYGVHGILYACSVTLKDMFDEIETWTNLPGHEQEIILVGLSIDKADGGSDADKLIKQDCQALGSALGGALVTPVLLQSYPGYSADPGQVTLGQLWSIPGHPRVILSDDTCLDDAAGGAGYPGGQWNPDPPFGSGPGQSFYANQCYADPYNEWWWQEYSMPGIKATIEPAAQTRAYQGGGDDADPGDPVPARSAYAGGALDPVRSSHSDGRVLEGAERLDLTQEAKCSPPSIRTGGQPSMRLRPTSTSSPVTSSRTATS